MIKISRETVERLEEEIYQKDLLIVDYRNRCRDLEKLLATLEDENDKFREQDEDEAIYLRRRHLGSPK